MRFAPAWYPDPTGLHDHRWWDGEEWTAHVADAGVASTDPLAAAAATAADPRATAAAGPAGPAAPTASRIPTPGIAVGALVLGIVALLLGLVPFLGALVAVVAIVIGIVGRRRSPAGSGRGLTTAGLILASLALAIGLATSAVAVALLRDGSGGAIGSAIRAYAACIEVQSDEVCEARLTADLLDALGG